MIKTLFYLWSRFYDLDNKKTLFLQLNIKLHVIDIWHIKRCYSVAVPSTQKQSKIHVQFCYSLNNM